MTIMYAVMALLVGWCGTPWPGWPRPKRPGAEPDPDPWLPGIVIGALGGLIGGFGVSLVFPSELSLLTMALGALVGGRIASDIARVAIRR